MQNFGVSIIQHELVPYYLCLFNFKIVQKYPGEEMETPGNHVDRCYKSYLYLISEDLITKLIGCIGSEDASKFTDTMILTLRVSSNMLEGSTGYIFSIFPINVNGII